MVVKFRLDIRSKEVKLVRLEKSTVVKFTLDLRFRVVKKGRFDTLNYTI